MSFSKKYPTVSQVLASKLDFDSLRDYLVNGIEHEESEEGSITQLTEYGLTKEEAKKINDAWWGMDPMKRFHLSPTELDAWIKSQLKTPTVSQVMALRIDFEALGDYLANGLGQGESEEDCVDQITEYGVELEDAKKLLEAWQTLKSRDRIELQLAPPEEVADWVELQLKL